MQNSPMRNALAIISVAAMLAACAVGIPFVRPQLGVIELGKTTYAQVVERFGKPRGEERLRRDDVLLRKISYYYSSESETPRAPNRIAERLQNFVFSDDIVVAEYFVSSFAADHTDFDERKVGDIVKGTTRCAEVEAMLGRPCGRLIYPAVENKGESAIYYGYGYETGPVLQSKRFMKSLSVDCDSAGIVKNVSYSELGDR